MTHRRRHALAALLVAAALASCARDDREAPGPKPGAGPLPAEGSGVTQRGRIVVARSGAPLDGATITIAGRSVVAAQDGTYSIAVPRNVPYATTISAPDHYTLLEQEWSAAADVERGDENLLPVNLANLLASFLPNRDAAKGVLAVHVAPVRGCTDEGGSTLAIAPAGSAQLRYFAGGIPSGDAKAVTKGEDISAVFYNVDVGAPLTVTATSPSCTPLGFPITEDGVTYTGNVRAAAGETLAYVRIFVGPRSADAGTD